MNRQQIREEVNQIDNDFIYGRIDKEEHKKRIDKIYLVNDKENAQ